MESKFSGMFGMAVRAGKVIYGNYSVKAALMKGRLSLVVIGSGISDRSRKDAVNMCEYYKTDYIEPDIPDLIENISGKKEVYVVGITDPNMAKQLKKIITA
ncbi:MAG: ribosomal L7Ae/L30e/S12e/Gadd45 family protein [Christensenellaceae bacterium]|nr:ribosomal L7Ae/L30e/S12e/Gadd45 family protein [Christensenellaceae bacterium]